MQLAVLGGSSLLSGTGLLKTAILGASVAGSILLNGKQKPVGKLNDLRISSSSYGRGIPKVWGTMRVTGNMFWATDFREEKLYLNSKGKEKTGKKARKLNKKGKVQVTYKYFGNFAMGLCEGPMDDILRVWADGNLIYNKLNPEDKDLVEQGFSTEDSEDQTGKASMKSAGGKKGGGGASGQFAFTFYSGDESQLPDPRMEREEGEGNVPAYRGLCYLMFEDFAMEDFGNRIPTITAEVVSKSRRKPMVRRFTNFEEPASGWNQQFINPSIDLVRGNLIAAASDNDGDKYIRVYDMETRREKKRWNLEDLFPQTAPHISQPTIGAVTEADRTWTLAQAKQFELFGTTPNGDIIYHWRNKNNSPLIFMDPTSGTIIKSIGSTGSLFGQYWDGLFVLGGAFPMIGAGTNSIPVGYTVAYSTFGTLYLFDEDYYLVDKIYSTGRRLNYTQGTVSTTQGIYFTSTDYGGTTQYTFYTAPLQGSNPGQDPANITPSLNEEQVLSKWPEVAGSKGQLKLFDMAFVVGAQAICCIIGAGTDLWAVKVDAIFDGGIIWQKKIEGANVGASNLTLGGFQCPPSYINTNYYNFYHGDILYKIDFKLEKVFTESSIQGSGHPNIDAQPQYYWSEKDAMITFTETEDDPLIDQPVIIYGDRKVQEKVSLQTIVSDVGNRVGISSADINATDLETQEELVGYMFEQPTEARSVIEELSSVFMFDCVEVDGGLVFKMRGGPSVRTIYESELGVVSSDIGTDNERIIETTTPIIELPERVSVSFYDPKKDYETGQQHFKRALQPIPVMNSKVHSEFTFQMALNRSDAKSMSKRILYAAWGERTSVNFKLPRDHMALDPSDAIDIVMNDGRTLTVRITDLTLGANYEIEATGVSQIADHYTFTDEADDPQGIVKQTRSAIQIAKAFIYNIPYLSDSDENPNASIGYYWGAGAYGEGFNYGILESKFDDAEWTAEGATTVDVLWGYVKGVPAPANGWNVEDTTTQLVLTPAFDFNETATIYTWENILDDDWPSENNMIIIDDEIILFKEAVENGDGTITISRLIRGYRGSIDAAYKHGLQSTWTLVSGNSVHIANEDLTYLNQTQRYCIAAGSPFATLVGTTHYALDGSTERPLPVGDIRRTNVGDGSVTFTWSRSSRLGGSLKDGTGTVALNEEVENYYLFILAAPYDAKTWDPDDAGMYLYKSPLLTSSTKNVTSGSLSAISKTNLQDLHIVIHQMSASVGWGYPSPATMPYTQF